MRFPSFIVLPALALIPLCGSASAAATSGKEIAGQEAASKAKSPAAPSAASSVVQWVALEEGVKRAAATGKYVFVTVYTDWCGYCRKLNTVTLRAEPVLTELNRNFQSVRVNAESAKPVVWEGKKMSEREVAGKAWGVTGYPTMLFLSPKGKIIGSYSAFAEADLMVRLLTYISSGARERNVSFEDFLEGKT